MWPAYDTTQESGPPVTRPMAEALCGGESMEKLGVKDSLR